MGFEFKSYCSEKTKKVIVASLAGFTLSGVTSPVGVSAAQKDLSPSISLNRTNHK